MQQTRPQAEPTSRQEAGAWGRRDWIVAALALGAFLLALLNLGASRLGVTTTRALIGHIPATIFHPSEAGRVPAVVIAHGFAGSQQLMQSFALAFARNGYVAVTFDFAGHGRNPRPLTGNVADPGGATRVLVDELSLVADAARNIGDGRIALLGHSMASDIVVRYAAGRADVAATIAVSMFSRQVTASEPRNLLVIAGQMEGMLRREALRAVGLAAGPEAPEAGVTYGDHAAGTARRAAVSPFVEHASVLFSQASLREALSWLDQSFGAARPAEPDLDRRGPWILLLIAGAVALAAPLAKLLPVVARPPLGAGLPWRQLWLPLLAPMLATPLILRVTPTHFLPVLVADYLAAHFALYGALTALMLLWLRRSRSGAHAAPGPSPAMSPGALAVASLAAVLYGFVALFLPIDAFVTSFSPGPERLPLILALLAGTLCFFLATEWLTRGPGAARGGHALCLAAFLVSLMIAVALDFQRLFFLVIIIPVMIPVLLVYGLFSGWIQRRTGHPAVGAIANAVAFAFAIGVTFPLVAG